jgi:predicted acylesterase/phospholipase RssA
MTLSKLMLPETIMMSSGGILVLSHVGALKYLESKKRLSRVKRWAGVSGGALLATCIVLGYTIREMQEICERFDFQVLQKIDQEGPFRFLETFGLDTGENIQKFICALFRVHGWSPQITFMDLHKSKCKDLIVWAADIDTGSLKEFSFEKTPDFQVAIALQASMQIPIIYPPLTDVDSNHLLVDGALIHSMPLSELREEYLKTTLGILCKSQPPQPAPRDVLGYVKHLVSIGIDSRTQLILNQYGDKIINISLPSDFSGINFNLTVEQKKLLLDSGENAAKQWCNNCSVPKRRHSI